MSFSSTPKTKRKLVQTTILDMIKTVSPKKQKDRSTGVCGIKRTVSGSLFAYPGRESLITQHGSIIEKRPPASASPGRSPSPLRRSSSGSVFENLVYFPISPKEIAQEREFVCSPSDGDLNWDAKGDLEKTLYESGGEEIESNHEILEDSIEEEQMPHCENDDYYEDEDEEDFEAMIQRICTKSVAECLAGLSERMTVDRHNIHKEVEGMLETIKKMENILVKSIEKQGKQSHEKLSRMEAQIEALKAIDEQKENRLKKLELSFSQLLAENKTQERNIIRLTKLVEESREKGHVAEVEADNADQDADTDAPDASDKKKSQFTEVEKQNLRGLLAMQKHQQREYFNKSIKISNIGTIPKTAEGVSRFDAVHQLLKRKGLGFLLKNCESFYVYSNSALRLTFKTFGDRNYFVSRARKVLKDNNNRTIWLESLVSPADVGVKKRLLQIGKDLKTSNRIIKFTVQYWQGSPKLRTVSHDQGIKWISENEGEQLVKLNSELGAQVAGTESLGVNKLTISSRLQEDGN